MEHRACVAAGEVGAGVVVGAQREWVAERVVCAADGQGGFERVGGGRWGAGWWAVVAVAGWRRWHGWFEQLIF